MGTGISQIRLGEGGVIITDSLILTSKQRSIVTKKIMNDYGSLYNVSHKYLRK